MKRLLILILIFSSELLNAQYKLKQFTFNSKNKITNSIYNKIAILDNREDTSRIGYLLEGRLKTEKVNLNPSTTISEEFKNLLNNITDSTASNGELLLQINKLVITENEETSKTDGIINLKLNLFSKSSNSYVFLSKLDTFIDYKEYHDEEFSGKLLVAGKNVIVNFISKNLKNKTEKPYELNFETITKFDSFEKSLIPIYVNSKYKNGFYKTYNSFKNQTPEALVCIKKYNIETEIDEFTFFDENNKTVSLNYDKIYAKVISGVPLVRMGDKFYELYRKNNNLYFEGTYNLTNNTAVVVGSTIMFGIIGGLVANSLTHKKDVKAEYILDYYKGSFNYVRDIEQQEIKNNSNKEINLK